MRLFFALWPGEAVRRALAGVAGPLAQLASGRPVPAANLHLTLAFLGEVAADRIVDLHEAAGTVRVARFEVVLDQVGSFRAARVAWAGASRMPAALASLQSSLDAALRARGFKLEDRAFAAHVTLARKIEKPVPRAAMPPIRWRPRDFALVHSQPGTGRYAVVESWPLDRG
jgi:2'-5' RNA ligase